MGDMKRQIQEKRSEREKGGKPINGATKGCIIKSAVTVADCKVTSYFTQEVEEPGSWVEGSG